MKFEENCTFKCSEGSKKHQFWKFMRLILKDILLDKNTGSMFFNSFKCFQGISFCFIQCLFMNFKYFFLWILDIYKF